MTLGLLDHGWAAAIALFSLGAAWSGWRQARGRSSLGEPAVMSSSDKWSVYLGSSAPLWILGGATLGVWLLRRRPLETLGFGAPGWTWWATVVLAIFIAGLTWDTLRQLSPERIDRTRTRWRTETPFMPATRGEVARYSVLALSAGFGEEVAFRGFLIAYLGAFFGLEWPGVALAIGLPAAFFGVSHAYQGVRGVIGATAGALCLGFIVVETGSLWPAILFHAVWDLLMGLPGLRLMNDPTPS